MEAGFARRYFDELKSNTPINSICYIPIVCYFIFLEVGVGGVCQCFVYWDIPKIIVEYILPNCESICLT